MAPEAFGACLVEGVFIVWVDCEESVVVFVPVVEGEVVGVAVCVEGAFLVCACLAAVWFPLVVFVGVEAGVSVGAMFFVHVFRPAFLDV